MRLTMAASLLVLAVPAMAADIYRWVDANGSVHYSNGAPPSGVKATKVDVEAEPRAPVTENGECYTVRCQGERLEQIGNALLAMIVGVAKLGIDPTVSDEIVITTIEGTERETTEPTVAGETLLPEWEADEPETAKAAGSEFEAVLLVDGSRGENGAARYSASSRSTAST